MGVERKMDSLSSSYPFSMSTTNEALFELLQTMTKTNETHFVLLQKLNERIDHLEKKVSELQSAGGPCYRCGRTGHWASSCYAKTHINGNDLDSGDSEYNSE